MTEWRRLAIMRPLYRLTNADAVRGLYAHARFVRTWKRWAELWGYDPLDPSKPQRMPAPMTATPKPQDEKR